MRFLDWLMHYTDTYWGCYVLGSLLMAVVMLLGFVEKRRKIGWHEVRCIAICLPVFNIIIVAYLVLETLSTWTGREITIGRRRE